MIVSVIIVDTLLTNGPTIEVTPFAFPNNLSNVSKESESIVKTLIGTPTPPDGGIIAVGIGIAFITLIAFLTVPIILFKLEAVTSKTCRGCLTINNACFKESTLSTTVEISDCNFSTACIDCCFCVSVNGGGAHKFSGVKTLFGSSILLFAKSSILNSNNDGLISVLSKALSESLISLSCIVDNAASILAVSLATFTTCFITIFSNPITYFY